MVEELIEKILNVETIYNGHIINLQKRTVKLQSGKKTKREIIKHPGSVAIIPLIDNETIILIEQYRSALEKTILEIPAGTIEFNEKPDECAKRELLEETGYIFNNIKQIQIGYISPGYSDEKMYFYLATDLAYIKKNPEQDENIRIRKIKLKDATEMIKNGEIKDLKTIYSINKINSNL